MSIIMMVQSLIRRLLSSCLLFMRFIIFSLHLFSYLLASLASFTYFSHILLRF